MFLRGLRHQQNIWFMVYFLESKPSVCMLCFRGYYVVVVPLKKQRGKFLNPWEEPDQMNLDEVKHTLDRVSHQ